MNRVTHLTIGLLLGALLSGLAFAVSSQIRLAQDPVKLSPQYYKVLVDNDQVRVLEYRLQPGDKEPMHSHPAGVLYVFSDNKVKNTFPDGTTLERTRKAGKAYWREAITHAVENIGSTEVHGLAVELKNPCKR